MRTQINNQLSIIDNQWKGEPNYNTANRKSAIEMRKSLQILLKKTLKNSSNLQQFVSFSLRKSALFFTFSQRFIRIYKQMHAFCKLLKITYLTQCTTKTYKAFYPAQRVTDHERRATNYAKRTQFQNCKIRASRIGNMQNKANFNQRVTREERRKNAKQTQFKDLH
jgi:hypothetical protein